MNKSLLALLCCGTALAFTGIGCSSQNGSGGAPMTVSTGPPAPNAPSASDIAGQRAMASQMMAQSHAAARAAWQQHNPGKPLPTGL